MAKKKRILLEISHVKSPNGFGTHFSFIWQFGFEQGPNKAYKSQKKTYINQISHNYRTQRLFYLIILFLFSDD